MISDHPIIKKIAWTSGTRRAGASMETHREYIGYLDEWDGTERLTDEEIVRCRDCRFFEETGNCTWFECGTCGTQGEVTGDGFCAWGERRDA